MLISQCFKKSLTPYCVFDSPPYERIITFFSSRSCEMWKPETQVNPLESVLGLKLGCIKSHGNNFCGTKFAASPAN